MMRTSLTIIAFAGFYLLGWGASAQTVDFSVSGRKDNTFGTGFQPADQGAFSEPGAEWKFNKRDCLENVWFKVQITFSDGSEPPEKKYFVFGTSCSAGDGAACDDTLVEATSPKTFKIRDLVEECEGKGTADLNLFYEGDDGLRTWVTPSLKISWDFEPPSAPSDLKIRSGNGALFLDWKSDDDITDIDREDDTDTDNIQTQDDNGAGYLVVYLSADEAKDLETNGSVDTDTEAVETDSETGLDSDSQTSSDSASDSDSDSTLKLLPGIVFRAADVDTDTSNTSIPCPAGGFEKGDALDPDLSQFENREKSQTSSYRLRGLKNGVVYKVAVATYDDYRNISPLSSALCGRPAETIGFNDILEESGFDNKGYCFIATAAFGSYDHPTVLVLRSFRDRFLAQMPGGPTAIKTYYAVGPYLAAALGHNDTAKAAVQNGLSAFAVYSQWLLRGAPMPQGAWFFILAALLAVITLGTAFLTYRRIR